MRPELRLVQDHHVFQPELGRHLAHHHRDRHLETVRDEVAFVLLHQFVAITADGGGRVERLGRHNAAWPPAGIGHALDIENQIANGIGHGRKGEVRGQGSEVRGQGLRMTGHVLLASAPADPALVSHSLPKSAHFGEDRGAGNRPATILTSEPQP